MPTIIPIRELKNTAKISALVHEEGGPIFVTKNGYDDMVIMSSEEYDFQMFLSDVRRKLEEAEKSIERGEGKDFFASMQEIRDEYGI
ncbi:MAG: type II toxin-antitoxin system Phd/YefM family antitoxin [Actinomycetes bacterium]|jgi:prevent-host-death family protein|nr:type II toxin-antitoxin system Phd/YefM family antitoxin [Actinomycetes bacterium]